MESRLPVVSITLHGINPGSLAHRLDSEYGIMTRAGLHCAPLAHQGMGTLPQGTLRFSPGAFNTAKEIQKVIQALQDIASQLS